MNNEKGNREIEERALDALLTAAFKLDFPEVISDEAAEIFFQSPARLSPEDKALCESWGDEFIAKIIEGKNVDSIEEHQQSSVDEGLKQELYAMNRDKDGNGLDEETRRKIDEERKKALDEEESKDKDQNDES